MISLGGTVNICQDCQSELSKMKQRTISLMMLSCCLVLIDSRSLKLKYQDAHKIIFINKFNLDPQEVNQVLKASDAEI